MSIRDLGARLGMAESASVVELQGRTGCFYQNAKNLNGSKQFSLGTAEPTLKRDKTEVQTVVLPETGPFWVKKLKTSDGFSFMELYGRK